MARKSYEDLPDYARDFLSYYENILGKSPNTIRSYYSDLKLFFRFLITRDNKTALLDFDNVSVSDLSIDVIRKVKLSDFYDFMTFVGTSRSNSAYARARKTACLRSFFKYLNTKSHLIEENPTKELDSPKTRKSLPKYLSLQESRKLLSAIDGKFKERDFAIITLFLNCGMRLSELVGINLNDLKENTLTVIGKGNKERTVYLNKACLEAIGQYMKVRPRDGVIDRNALFLSQQKRRITPRMVENIVKKHLTAAGLDTEKYSPHKLRHTAATLMHKYGEVDIRVLQEILGHERLSTTEIYTHVDDEQLQSAIEQNPLARFTDSE